jgi:hypothetical protein
MLASIQNNRNSHSLQLRIQNGTTTLGGNMAISYKTRCTFAMFFFYYFIIHMCTQGLGHFSPLLPPPPLPPTSPPPSPPNFCNVIQHCAPRNLLKEAEAYIQHMDVYTNFTPNCPNLEATIRPFNE